MNQNKLNEILKKHQLWLNDQKDGERADLRGEDLSRADLSGVKLTGADFRGADFRGVKLVCADLSRADFRGVKLTGADLSHAKLLDADFRGVKLTGADFLGADFLGANLRDAVLEGALLRNCIGNGREIKTIIADPWNIVLTKDVVWIGCRKFSTKEWKSLAKRQMSEQIARADDGLSAEDLVTQWVPVINAMFETFDNR